MGRGERLYNSRHMYSLTVNETPRAYFWWPGSKIKKTCTVRVNPTSPAWLDFVISGQFIDSRIVID